MEESLKRSSGRPKEGRQREGIQHLAKDSGRRLLSSAKDGRAWATALQKSGGIRRGVFSTWAINRLRSLGEIGGGISSSKRRDSEGTVDRCRAGGKREAAEKTAIGGLER